jgi:hypothetical protein
MLLKNLDIANGLANGSCGTVVNIKPNVVEVLFDTNKQIVPIQRVDFEMPVNTKSKTIQITNEDGYTTKIIATKKKIVRNQYPLRLAYGITIHKSQGMTFDKLIVDCGRVFADGQAYVALSRTRSLQGLYPINFDHTTVTVSKAVVEFYKKLDDMSVINDLTDMSVEIDEKEKLIRQAIEEGKKLKIKYHSNSLYKNETTIRTIVPQRIAEKVSKEAIQTFAIMCSIKQDIILNMRKFYIDYSFVEVMLLSDIDYYDKLNFINKYDAQEWKEVTNSSFNPKRKIGFKIGE